MSSGRASLISERTRTIKELLAQGGQSFSFEFFPPKTDDAARELEKAIGELQPLSPSFVSVTYGAGGSTRERTRDIVIHIQRDAGITAMAHLTCIAHTQDQLVSLLEEYREAGIDNILALAGDPPTDTEDYPRELEYALELVDLVFGDSVQLGGFIEVTLLIVTLLLSRKLVRRGLFPDEVTDL